MPRPRFWFYHWKGGYNQALALAEALDGRIIKRSRSQYRYQPGDIVVNWGSSVVPNVLRNYQVLNPFNKVGHGKRSNWVVLQAAGIQVPTWTSENEEARAWNCRVVGRDSDHSMGGQYIEIHQRGEPVAQHMYYVKYVKKEREFRFHVFKGRVIFTQEKLRRKDAENVDRYIRSHNRGWCFAFNHLPNNPPPPNGEALALAAVQSLQLDFGAVDVGWNARSGYTVFEVNTAPGIENTSLQAYVEALRAL